MTKTAENRPFRVSVGALVGASMLFGAAAAYLWTADEPVRSGCAVACDPGDPDDCPQSCLCNDATARCEELPSR